MYSSTYVGRFAPTPSGTLHFGSLVAALGSYLQARAHGGKWLIRIEDIDLPRSQTDAVSQILSALEAYHLFWDGDVFYQSQRLQAYQQQIDNWLQQGMAYYCQCSRKQIQAAGGHYLGRCRDKKLAASPISSVRLQLPTVITAFEDKQQGWVQLAQEICQEDFVLQRRDGIYSYHLAVVLDDIQQGVTEVVRGIDLIDLTGRQMAMYQLLQEPCIQYLHLPLALAANGQKLSKQNKAAAIPIHHPQPVLRQAIQFLGLTLPAELQDASLDALLQWAIAHWPQRHKTSNQAIA